MRGRIAWVDTAKGIGILLVFMGHLVEESWPGMWAYSFHLPLFFFLSGFLFSTKVSFKEFVSKKAKSILLPYITMGLVICFFDALWKHSLSTLSVKPAFLPQFIKNLFYFVIQNRFATLWYLAVLFWINLMMYLIVKIIKKTWLGLFVVVVLLLFGSSYYSRGGVSLPWNVDTVLMALPFFYAGYLFQIYPVLQKPFVSKKIKDLVLAVMLYFISVELLRYNEEKTGFGLEMYNNEYGVLPVTYLCAFAGILLTIIVSNHISLRGLTYIGKNSLVFFLLHQAVVYPLLDALYLKLGYGSLYTSTWRFIWVVTTKILITCVLMFFINEVLIKTRLRVLLGKS
ncbi:MAG: acyltransferase family protein [Lachnospiraceae bacterium]|nr:acyltransferase family protein [Lachnospiraceae bacterium]